MEKSEIGSVSRFYKKLSLKDEYGCTSTIDDKDSEILKIIDTFKAAHIDKISGRYNTG